ncbi:MSMEG_4193 family putative phosphomutase [Nocardia sp. CDC159]|uniref:MSMEG_4193 family putative phosphomutase n=1 Tax=Nocardia pulmonis TaxID=2951408 RepID=A0A9X2IW47_9NOCA|nr:MULTISPECIES: histidine phosphatase family protein [Nocardia]MCM6772465.1 MSMEG_4193 family putative phosphomutase [Nocardia pulmonis]MCM6784877.1 MSMEG_4193 family putative phosphomutase [Nocardia sp. CDC159]
MTVILLRHGVSASNTARTLAGRSPGVDLTDRGREQAQAVAARLGALPIEHIVASPLLRCQRTIAPLADKLGLRPQVEEALAEVDYGDWTGRTLDELVKEPLWKVVQRHASAAVFPGGEGLAQVQHRAVAAVRAHDARLGEQHGRDVLWVACSHGDVIKAVLADAFGVHLDGFQRIVVEPASISVVRYTPTAPYVWRVNDTGADLSALVATVEQRSGQRAGPVPGGEVGAAAGTDNGNAERPESRSE